MSFLTNKTILIVSPERWDGLFVSKHHYAIHLAERGNHVIFLNPPSKGLSISDTNIPNLVVFEYDGFARGMSYFPKAIRRFITNRVFSKIQSMVGRSIDIIWSFDNSVFYQFDALAKSVLKISHIVDLNMNFQMKKASRSADICFCTTDHIRRRFLSFRSNSVHKINHGFSPITTNETISLPGSQTTKVVYAGNLAMKYLDWQIIHDAVKENENVDFLFYGSNADVVEREINPLHEYKEEVIEFSNAYFPGRLPSSKLNAALSKADVLIIAYQEQHHEDQANPHKVMEYLHTGKPIVATYTQEYEDKNLLIMSDSNDQWPKLLKKVLSNLSGFTTEEMKAKRREYALSNTYDNHIDAIEILLKDVLDNR